MYPKNIQHEQKTTPPEQSFTHSTMHQSHLEGLLKTHFWGAWVAQSVICLTHDFGSGNDLGGL